MTNNAILNQVRSEYEEGRSYLEPRKTRWSQQLRMLNNLQRGEGNIASTTLYSFLQRVFGSLYSNTMTVKFTPGNDAEIQSTESLNKLAISDAQEMDKSMIDFDWLWDTCFFGRGYVETLVWNAARKLLEPSVINPMFLSYDPYFSDPQEWRYYSKWKLMNKQMLQRLIDDKELEVSNVDEVETGVDPYIWQWKMQSELAKDVNPPSTDSIVPSSNIYQILEHATYLEGKKFIVQTNRSMSTVLRKMELDLDDDPDHKGESLWPLVTKQIFREPHSSATVSVPDLVEDKHRALNVLLNLAYIAVKDEVNPLYLYDTSKVTNPSQFFQRQPNQHIAVSDTAGAVLPIKQKPSLSSSALAFINTMKSEASDAIGTAMPAGLGQQKKKNATQDAQLQQIADLVQSLQAKLVQNGEMDFWSQWYHRNIKHAKEGDIKIAVITDSMGTTFEQIELDKIKTKYPPRIVIMASKEAEYKEMVERRELAGQLKLIQDVLQPTEFKIFLKEIYFPKFKTFDQSSIDVVMPKSSGEIMAEQENSVLAKGEFVEVKETDDDEMHLAIHMRAKKNEMTNTHIFTHQYSLAQKRDQQQKQAAAAAQPADQGGGDTQKEAAQTTAQAKTKPEQAAIPSAGQKTPLQPQPTPTNV